MNPVVIILEQGSLLYQVHDHYTNDAARSRVFSRDLPRCTNDDQLVIMKTHRDLYLMDLGSSQGRRWIARWAAQLMEKNAKRLISKYKIPETFEFRNVQDLYEYILIEEWVPGLPHPVMTSLLKKLPAVDGYFVHDFFCKDDAFLVMNHEIVLSESAMNDVSEFQS